MAQKVISLNRKKNIIVKLMSFLFCFSENKVLDKVLFFVRSINTARGRL